MDKTKSDLAVFVGGTVLLILGTLAKRAVRINKSSNQYLAGYADGAARRPAVPEQGRVALRLVN